MAKPDLELTDDGIMQIVDAARTTVDAEVADPVPTAPLLLDGRTADARPSTPTEVRFYGITRPAARRDDGTTVPAKFGPLRGARLADVAQKTTKDATQGPLARILAAWLMTARNAHTRDAHAVDVERFTAWLNAIDPDTGIRRRLALTDVRGHHLDDWVKEMTDDGAAAATIARRVASISALYRYLIHHDVVDKNPAAGVDRRPFTAEGQARDDGVRTEALTKADAETLLDGADAQDPAYGALVALGYLRGLRVSEIVDARRSDLGVTDGTNVLHVRRKHQKEKTTPVPVPDRALESLRVHHLRFAVPDDGPLLVLPRYTDDGHPITDDLRPMTRRDADRIVRRLGAKILGRDGTDPSSGREVHCHMLRASFITHLLAAGVPLREVQKAADHADPSTTARYDQNDLRPTSAAWGLEHLDAQAPPST